jgi:glycine/D-amino acid oxidase-like deaminating enzyme
MPNLSVWESESFFAPADIIIAGGGLVGLWSAVYLKKAEPTLRITIVERGLIPTGASTRNAGFACFGSLTELVADEKQLGGDKMLQLVEMRYKGLRRLHKTFDEKDIGYERHGGYELIAGNPDINQLRHQIDDFNRRLKEITGQQKTFRLQNDRIDDFGFAGIHYLIENKLEAQLHSGKLCQALLAMVASQGVNVLNNLEITGIEKLNGRLQLSTNRENIKLSATQLLVCTNAFARQLLPQLDIIPARGQVLVTSPIPRLPFKGTFHFDEGFYYFRDLGNRVLLGGARNIAFDAERTGEMVITGQIQAALENFLQETILPARPYTIEHRWSGIMGMGGEKFPILEAIDDQVFCAVRMSGMGVALAPLIGERAAELLLGR